MCRQKRPYMTFFSLVFRVSFSGEISPESSEVTLSDLSKSGGTILHLLHLLHLLHVMLLQCIEETLFYTREKGQE
jgi:hypothetical protein